MTKLNRLGFLSNREREFLQGKHDDKYYQYQANIRSRLLTKVEALKEDLPLLVGNDRLNSTKTKPDWSFLINIVNQLEESQP